MKVHGGGRPPESTDVVRLQKSGKNGRTEATSNSGVEDKVDLSGKAKEIADLVGIAKALPDVRTEKVAEIKERIDAGKYVVDPAKVAQRMIDEIV
jgi:negative regulator of flagellin synthesis FlgM